MLTAMQNRSMGLAAAGLLFIAGAVPNGQAPASVAARPAFAEPSIAPTAARSPSCPAATSGPCPPPAARRGCWSRTPPTTRVPCTRPTSPARVRLDAHRRRRHLRADVRHRRRAPPDVRRRAGTARRLVARRQVALLLRRAPAISRGMNDVYRVAADGGTPMPVSADRYANEFFSAASPDGRTLAMSAPAASPPGSGGGTATATSTKRRSGCAT